MVRMLLKILAYNSPEQKTLLPDKWEIEHIFPQKWDTSFFTLSDDEANIKLEHLGNKIPLEKPMNIRASNNYFDKKKDVYGNSNIAIAKALGKSNKASWVISDIDARDIQVNNELVSLLDQWVKDYEPKADTPSAPQPTPEQAEMIRQLKAAGLI
jgi:hypothetical protein